MPHRTAVRRAWAPVTARAKVLNWVWRRRAQGRAASEAVFWASSERAGKGGIFRLCDDEIPGSDHREHPPAKEEGIQPTGDRPAHFIMDGKHTG